MGVATYLTALQSAFEQHYVAILRLGFLLCGTREGAEDLAQETFFRVAGKLKSLTPDEVRPYLRRAAMNIWKNQKRKLFRESRSLLRQRVSRRVEEPPLDERVAIWRAVMTLPDRQRACVVLRYYEDLTEQVVAQLLGCSTGTVKSHTSRALARLRREIANEA